MNDHSHSSMDNPLSDRDEKQEVTAAGAELERLVREVADPIISFVLRRQFHASLRSDDFSGANQDALEVASEIRIRLLPRLREAANGGGRLEIENLPAYIRSAAANACHDFLRKRYPRRLRLSNRIRYIIGKSGRFAIWHSKEGDLICGKADSQSDPVETTALIPEDLASALAEIAGGYSGFAGPAKVRALVDGFFEAHPQPVLFSLLVSTLADVLQVNESDQISRAEQVEYEIRDESPDVESRYQDRMELVRLWEDLETLPVRHRTAVLLNLRTDNGDNALTLFPALGIVTIAGIAESLELSPDELAEIWDRLPLDDLTIAEKLGLTRQQVINLRQSARAFLKRRRV